MRKFRIGFIVLSVLLILALVGCSGNPSNLNQTPVEDYVNRYPGEYNTSLSDYSSIQIKDNDGNDISHIAIDLWYAANEIYNVDDMKMFEIGEYEATLSKYTVQSNELLNYYAVVESVFTQNGIAQLEQTMIGGPKSLIRKKDDKVYRMGAWKSGYSFANALTDMQVKEFTGNKITLAVTYASINRDNTTVTVDFTITIVDGTWLVDDYVYPEAYKHTSEDGISATSYDKFFNQNIDFVNNYTLSGDTQVFIFYEGNRNVMYRDGDKTLNTFPGAVEGYLYIEKLNTDNPDDYFFEYFPLLEEQVTIFEQVVDRVLCAVGNTLYSINNYDGGDKQVVLTADGIITHLKANDTLVFYVVNEDIYRYYVPDKITDKLCQAPGILPGFPVPLTNHQIYWGVYEPDHPENDYRSWHIYTGPDAEAMEISEEVRDQIYEDWAKRVRNTIIVTPNTRTVIFPASDTGKTEYNARIYEIEPFYFSIDLPDGWTLKERKAAGEFDIKLALSGVWSILDIFNENNERVGAVGYNTYEPHEGATYDPQVIYSQIALGNDYRFDIRDSYYNINDTGDMAIALVDVYYAANANNGVEKTNKGIVARNNEFLVYIAAEFDSSKITDEQVVSMAQSVQITQ